MRRIYIEPGTIIDGSSHRGGYRSVKDHEGANLVAAGVAVFADDEAPAGPEAPDAATEPVAPQRAAVRHPKRDTATALPAAHERHPRAPGRDPRVDTSKVDTAKADAVKVETTEEANGGN